MPVTRRSMPTRQAEAVAAQPEPVAAAALFGAKANVGLKRKALDPIQNHQQTNVAQAAKAEVAKARVVARARAPKAGRAAETKSVVEVTKKVAVKKTVAATAEASKPLGAKKLNVLKDETAASAKTIKKEVAEKENIPPAKIAAAAAGAVSEDDSVNDKENERTNEADKENSSVAIAAKAVPAVSELPSAAAIFKASSEAAAAAAASAAEAKSAPALVEPVRAKTRSKKAKAAGAVPDVPEQLSNDDAEEMAAFEKMIAPKAAPTAVNVLRSESEMIRIPQAAPLKKFRRSELARDYTDLDLEDEFDPVMVAEYVDDCMAYMLEIEMETLPLRDYMSRQKELDSTMRTVLVEWIVEVHTKFRMLPETLFLTVNIVDRFLSIKPVSVGKLQLVGLAALVIASKYEEIYAPSVQDFVYMSDNGFDRKEILSAERFVLKVLKFNLKYPNPLHFLRRGSKADAYDLENRTMAKYILESIMLDEGFLGVPQSLAAAAALYISRLALKGEEWNPTIAHFAGYTLKQMKPTILQMLHHLVATAEDTPSSVFRKYQSSKVFAVSETIATFALGRVGHDEFGINWE